MAKPYETGLRDEVVFHAMACAIRDRQEYLESWTPQYVQLLNSDEEVQKVIEETKAEIRDFYKLAKSFLS